MSSCRIDRINHQAFHYYRRLSRVEAYCREHYAEDVKLKQAADVAALERTYFSDYFHRKVGVCFNCWFTSLRIEEAKARMSRSNAPITAIAHDVGYGSLGSFERAFKRCTGMTASEFKEEVRPDRG